MNKFSKDRFLLNNITVKNKTNKQKKTLIFERVE